MRTEIKLWELALYKLADAGALTLEEAKTLKCLWARGKMDLWQICDETKVDVMEVAEAMKALHQKGLIQVSLHGYEVMEKEAALAKLIDHAPVQTKEKTPLVVVARG